MTRATGCDRGSEGNTSTDPQSRKWSITINNYTSEEVEQLKQYFRDSATKYVIGKEVGKEEGTPHIQAHAIFKSSRRFSTLHNLFPRAHIEKQKKTDYKALAYCMKEEIIEGRGMPAKELIRLQLINRYAGTIWKPWQQDILDLIQKEADDRTINWIYDPKGNNGKSFLKKYIALTTPSVTCDGKKENVFHQVSIKINEDNIIPKVILMDIPRDMMEFFKYGTIEQLKDGHIYSGKYEGSEIFLPPVHVIIFSNSYPDTTKFSADRWRITTL